MFGANVKGTMKRSIIHFVLGAVLAGLVTACAHHKPATGVKMEVDNAFQGSIDKIDVKNQSVTVQHWPLFKTFKVGPLCEISVPSKDSGTTLADLKVGDFVIVAYQGTGTGLEATRIATRSREFVREKEEQYERLEEMLYPSPNQ